MKKSELIILYNNFDLLKEYKGVKFAYGISKNKEKIKSETKSLQEASRQSEKYSEFENKRLKLCRKYSKKDNNYNPIIENDNFVLINQDDFDEEFKILKEEYKDTIKERETQIEEYEKLLGEEIKIDFYKIEMEDIPADITVKHFEVIKDLIK